MTESDTRQPRAIERPYVERVRFSWERKLETALSNVHDAGGGHDEEPLPPLVRLTKASAPRLYRLAREVAETLGFSGCFVLFQTPAFDQVNAQALRNRDPFAVRLIGPATSLLDEGALRALIGHEFGHYLAHGTASSPGSRVLRLAHADTRAGMLVRNACSIAAELTADRFALLACQDLAATIRLEVVSVTLTSADSLGLREYEYLADVSERIVEGKVARLDQTHPSPEFRMYASWLFSRSDEYRRLTDRGPGDLTLGEVDDCLMRLLVTPELESALLAIATPRMAAEVRAPRRLPRSSRPAGAILSPFEAALLKERLMRGTWTLIETFAERARKRLGAGVVSGRLGRGPVCAGSDSRGHGRARPQ
jgi:hypothetical protein